MYVYSHSNFFYWWPVWAVGFVMTLLTWIDGSLMVIVPKGTEALRHARVEAEVRPGERRTLDSVDVLVAPKGKHLHPDDPALAVDQPYLHVATNKSYGVLYAIILLVCIVITNVPLRGLWSVVVLVTLAQNVRQQLVLSGSHT